MRAIYLLPLFASVTIATLRECTVLELLPCAFLIDDDKPSISGTWPETDHEMDIHCQRSLKSTKCMHDFAVRCQRGEFAHLSQFLIEKHELLEKICNPESTLRKRYLKHAKCMNANHAKHVEACGLLMEYQDSDTFKETHCNAHKVNTNCHYEEIKKHCGADAKALLQEMLDPTNNMMNKLCEGRTEPKESDAFAFMQSVYRSPMF